MGAIEVFASQPTISGSMAEKMTELFRPHLPTLCSLAQFDFLLTIRPAATVNDSFVNAQLGGDFVTLKEYIPIRVVIMDFRKEFKFISGRFRRGADRR